MSNDIPLKFYDIVDEYETEAAAPVKDEERDALARYFLRRTLMRGKADNKRTQKMAGTDWSVYLPFMEENRQWFLSQPHEDVYIQSEDGLKLHGTYFPGKDPKRAVKL